ncbi:hypothetical protein, partial [Georgenia subflava]|uniref:hypothetical protein n=1 Tax=Georgenia subflava TaxID=1622177 RepID=UPI001D0EBAAC
MSIPHLFLCDAFWWTVVVRPPGRSRLAARPIMPSTAARHRSTAWHPPRGTDGVAPFARRVGAARRP